MHVPGVPVEGTVSMHWGLALPNRAVSLDQVDGGLVAGVVGVRIAALGFATFSVPVGSLFASRARPERIDATGTRPSG
jgi:hypothetical protein